MSKRIKPEPGADDGHQCFDCGGHHRYSEPHEGSLLEVQGQEIWVDLAAEFDAIVIDLDLDVL